MRTQWFWHLLSSKTTWAASSRGGADSSTVRGRCHSARQELGGLWRPRELCPPSLSPGLLPTTSACLDGGQGPCLHPVLALPGTLMRGTGVVRPQQ